MKSTIETWLSDNAWTHEGTRHGGAECYSKPGAGFLTVQPKCTAEPAFWAYYAPGNEDGEQANQTGTPCEVPQI